MSIRLGKLQRSMVFSLTIALAGTGLLWLASHYLPSMQTEFGAPHPTEPWALRLHGAAAMGFLVGLGSLLPVHVRRAWQAGRNVRTGAAMLAGIAALIVTGYALYYASSESLRPWISAIHWGIGLALVPALLLHEHEGGKTRAAAKTAVSPDQRIRGQAVAERPSQVPAVEP
jgi:hypothetical protein